MISLLLLIAANNMLSGWTLGIINICYVAEPGFPSATTTDGFHTRDLIHCIGPFGKDILTAFFSISIVTMVLLVMAFLHIGKVSKMIGTEKYHALPTCESQYPQAIEMNALQPVSLGLETVTELSDSAHPMDMEQH